jgi:cation-transporting ATPase E
LSETGIRFKVISGDNPQTVAALVKQAGLSSDIRAVSGLDLATMDTVDFATTAADATVFGRITPQQKEQLVDVLHKQGHYVAMIGDGVNDVLSLKKADLAIAMQSGSQATRSVADIVLLNDSFASLPSALREGQRIRNGMQDILKLYLTRVFYFVVLLSGASVVGGFPFEPTQASILVLLTVGIPSFLLAAWAHPGAREKDERRSLWRFVLTAGSTLGLIGLFLYFSEYVLADSLGLHRSSSAVAVKIALDAQTTLTIFALFCGIALLFFVEPPARFWVGGNELRGDKRISYLALAMCILSVLLISLSPLRSLFALTLLDRLDYLVIAVYVVIWVFLVRWVWRGHILERFLALE